MNTHLVTPSCLSHWDAERPPQGTSGSSSVLIGLVLLAILLAPLTLIAATLLPVILADDEGRS
jgi:hypothetical protein